MQCKILHCRNIQGTVTRDYYGMKLAQELYQVTAIDTTAGLQAHRVEIYGISISCLSSNFPVYDVSCLGLLLLATVPWGPMHIPDH